MPRGQYDRAAAKVKRDIISDVTEMHAVEGNEAPSEITPAMIEAAQALLNRAGFVVSGSAGTPEFANAADDVDLPLYHESPSAPELHALDHAPVNSKIVITALENVRSAVLATPSGIHVLPKTDPASKLPQGAKIRKTGPSTYVAEQLNMADDRQPLVCSTAGEAISRFLFHFHDVKP